MPDGHVKVSGSWKKLEGMHVKVSGTWKTVEKAYVKVSGSWKQFFTNLTVNLSGTTGAPNASTAYQTDPANTTGGWVFNTNGNMQRWEGNPASLVAWSPTPDEWTDPAQASIGSSYWIRFTHDTGDTANGGDSTGTWHALSTERSILWEQTSIGSRSGQVLVEISSDSSGTPVVASGYYSGYAEVESGA